MKVKCIHTDGYMLNKGDIYTVNKVYNYCNTHINCPRNSIDGKGYALNKVGYVTFIYPAYLFEIIEDITISQSVYDLIDYLRAVAKLNLTLPCIGSVIDAKKEWRINYADYDVAYAITIYKNMEKIYHISLVFSNNIWTVRKQISGAVHHVSKPIIDNDVVKCIEWIRNTIKTNPNTLVKINKLKDDIATLKKQIDDSTSCIEDMEAELKALSV